MKLLIHEVGAVALWQGGHGLRSEEFLPLRKDKNPAFDFCDAILIHEMNRVFIKNRIAKIETNRELEVTLRSRHNGNFINIGSMREEDVIRKNERDLDFSYD